MHSSPARREAAAVPGGRRGVSPGGDEFCLIATSGRRGGGADRPCVRRAHRAGRGFEIGESFGAVMLPDEATDASHALQLADERLYAQKHSSRGESDRTMEALLEALSEPRAPISRRSSRSRLALGRRRRRMLGLRRDELEELERAAQLHDIGKLAVPDEILTSLGRSTSRVGVHPPAHARRRADPERVGGSPGSHRRALDPRALGRDRLPRRPLGRGDPVAARIIPACCLLGDGVAPVPRGAHRR